MIRQKIIASIFISIFWLTGSNAQGKEDKCYLCVQTGMVVHQINAYGNYKLVSIDDSEEFLGHGTDNGGSLKGYYRGDSLKKIVEWVGLSNRTVENDYYFDKGMLVFVYSTNRNFKIKSNAAELDYSKLEKAAIGRYYFRNGSLVETIIYDKQDEKTKQQDAAGFLTSAREYTRLLDAKRK